MGKDVLIGIDFDGRDVQILYAGNSPYEYLEENAKDEVPDWVSVFLVSDGNIYDIDMEEYYE